MKIISHAIKFDYNEQGRRFLLSDFFNFPNGKDFFHVKKLKEFKNISQRLLNYSLNIKMKI